MALLEINKDTCRKCGICAGVCPAGIIVYRENKYPRPVPGADSFCLRCGHCVAACPTGSFIHAEVPLEQCLLIDPALQVSFEQCAQLVRSRRSIRFYRDKEVPREDIARIIDVARYAPTGHNSQEVQWTVFENRDEIREFTRIGVAWMRDMMEKHRHMDLIFGPVVESIESGHDIFLRDAPAVVVVHAEQGNPIAAIDCTIALSYFDLAASSLGLGCCWAGFFQTAAASFPPMIEAVALPEGRQVYGSLMVGYPKYGYKRTPVRRPASIDWRS